MDIVLDRKAKGLLPQNSNFGGFTRQPLTDDFNIAGHHGYESDSKRKNQKLSPASEERRLQGWRGPKDNLSRREEFDEENQYNSMTAEERML